MPAESAADDRHDDKPKKGAPNMALAAATATTSSSASTPTGGDGSIPKPSPQPQQYQYQLQQPQQQQPQHQPNKTNARRIQEFTKATSSRERTQQDERNRAKDTVTAAAAKLATTTKRSLTTTANEPRRSFSKDSPRGSFELPTSTTNASNLSKTNSNDRAVDDPLSAASKAFSQCASPESRARSPALPATATASMTSTTVVPETGYDSPLASKLPRESSSAVQLNSSTTPRDVNSRAAAQTVAAAVTGNKPQPQPQAKSHEGRKSSTISSSSSMIAAAARKVSQNDHDTHVASKSTENAALTAARSVSHSNVKSAPPLPDVASNNDNNGGGGGGAALTAALKAKPKTDDTVSRINSGMEIKHLVPEQPNREGLAIDTTSPPQMAVNDEPILSPVPVRHAPATFTISPGPSRSPSRQDHRTEHKPRSTSTGPYEASRGGAANVVWDMHYNSSAESVVSTKSERSRSNGKRSRPNSSIIGAAPARRSLDDRPEVRAAMRADLVSPRDTPSPPPSKPGTPQFLQVPYNKQWGFLKRWHRHKQDKNNNSGTNNNVNPHNTSMLKKTTMRTPHKKSIFNEDKPWKHHRHAHVISESERKRYEGLWATNKGIHMPYLLFPDTSNSEQIHGLAVRDLWRRSRLSDDTLERIWRMVDRNRNGCLDRDEFLVGMWLVDQCLYGRKLPSGVSSDVWSSVGRLNVKIKIGKGGDDGSRH